MKTCSRCGYQNTDSEKVCTNCLTDLHWGKVNLGYFSGTPEDTKRIGEQERKRHGVDNSSRYIMLAENLIQSNQVNQARAVLRETIRQFPSNERAWLLAACVAKTIEQSINCLQQAIYINPQSQTAQILLQQTQRTEICPTFSQLSNKAFVINTPPKMLGQTASLEASSTESFTSHIQPEISSTPHLNISQSISPEASLIKNWNYLLAAAVNEIPTSHIQPEIPSISQPNTPKSISSEVSCSKLELPPIATVAESPTSLTQSEIASAPQPNTSQNISSDFSYSKAESPPIGAITESSTLHVQPEISNVPQTNTSQNISSDIPHSKIIWAWIFFALGYIVPITTAFIEPALVAVIGPVSQIVILSASNSLWKYPNPTAQGNAKAMTIIWIVSWLISTVIFVLAYYS